MKKAVYMRHTIIFVFLVFWVSNTYASEWWKWGSTYRSSEIGDECTTALIAGWATPDGRPLIWKNRDVSNWHQEFNYYNETPYSFIAVNYPDNMTEAYGGVNQVGFVIENANALNFPDSAGVPDDDGIIMYHALQTCETVEDFLAYMDTTAARGRTRPAIYGVFDAYGGAGMLEASKYENFWFDANDTTVAPEGILVRANFAYQGSGSHIGQFRHDRAMELIQRAVAGDSITPRYLFDIVARDLKTEDVDPYPLPYQGYYIYQGDTLWGCVRDHNAVNREISQSCFVAQGIIPGENPLTSTMWIQCGEPTMTPAHPVWVAAGSVPPEVDGEVNAPICLRARELFEYLYLPYPDPFDDIIKTYRLIDIQGNGVLANVRSVEEGYYDFVEAKVENWRTAFPPQSVVENLQDSLAILVFKSMTEPEPVTDLVIMMETDGPRLHWSPVMKSVFGDSIEVSGYVVYSSDMCFPYSILGDSLGFTADTTFLPQIGANTECAFYQVRAVKLEE